MAGGMFSDKTTFSDTLVAFFLLSGFLSVQLCFVDLPEFIVIVGFATNQVSQRARPSGAQSDDEADDESSNHPARRLTWLLLGKPVSLPLCGFTNS